MLGVGAKAQTAMGPAAVSPDGDMATGRGVGSLETTSQCAGAVTVKVNVALRSGCSNVAKTRRASGISKCV